MTAASGAPVGAPTPAALATVVAAGAAASVDGGLADDPAALEQADATIRIGIRRNIEARACARLRG